MVTKYFNREKYIVRFNFINLHLFKEPRLGSLIFVNLGPVARSLVSANRWLRGIKMYRFPWYLTLVSTNHASSNPGLIINVEMHII